MHDTAATPLRRVHGPWTARLGLLHQRGPILPLMALWALTGALTALGVLVGALLPAIAPGGTPHPTLHGSTDEALSIFAHNLRVLAAPLILAASGWATSRITRAVGDTIVLATVLVSPLLVGAAIGRHGSQLLVYLPHVPIEWAALSAAAGAWVTVRLGHSPARRAAVPYGALAIALAALAAVIETVAIPHVT